jgi:uncharacterized damage-inducible protein DinB
MTLQEITTLFHYDRWATERTIESLSSLPEENYRKDLRSSFGSIHGTLVHIYWADCLWLARWEGRSSVPSISADQIPTLRTLNDRWQKYREDIHAYLANLSDGMLADPLPYTDTRGNEHSEPLYEQMQHKVNHSTYHRGQIVTMLRQLGQKPQATDLITFYRAREP